MFAGFAGRLIIAVHSFHLFDSVLFSLLYIIPAGIHFLVCFVIQTRTKKMICHIKDKAAGVGKYVAVSHMITAASDLLQTPTARCCNLPVRELL